MERSHVILSDSECGELTIVLHQSRLRSKVFQRVATLLKLDKDKTIEEVRRVPGLSYPTQLPN